MQSNALATSSEHYIDSRMFVDKKVNDWTQDINNNNNTHICYLPMFNELNK